MPAVPLRIRLTAVMATADQLGLTAWHIECDTDIARNVNVDNLNAIAEAYDGWLADDLKAALSQNANYLGLRVRYEGGTSASDLEVKYDGSAGPGTWATVGLAPTQLCGLIRKKTLQSGRHGRGRMYIPFPAEDVAAADGTPGVAYKAALQQIGNIVVQPRQVSLDSVLTWLYPVVTSANRAAPRYRIIDCPRADYFATQRRRGAFGQRNIPTL